MNFLLNNNSPALSVILNAALDQVSLELIINNLKETRSTLWNLEMENKIEYEEAVSYLMNLKENNDSISLAVVIEGSRTRLIFSQEKNKLKIYFFVNDYSEEVWIKPFISLNEGITYDSSRYIKFLLNIINEFEILELKYEWPYE